MLIGSCCLMVLLSYPVSFLILCLVMSIVERWVLQSSTIIIDLSISPLVLSVFASHILQLCCLVHTQLGLICLLGRLTLLLLYNVSFCLLILFCLKFTNI